MKTETLDQNAVEIAGDLTDKLLAPLHDTLATLEAALPGITERVTAAIDPDKIKGLVNEEVATSIKDLMAQGTEESLTAANALVKELRGLVEDSPVLSNTQTDGQEITLNDASKAIEIHASVKGEVIKGEVIRAVLPEASFRKNPRDQISYAKELGGRLATRKENLAVATALLEKEENGNLNQAEAELLIKYRKGTVIDSQGGLYLDGRRVRESFATNVDTPVGYGALVVLPSAESK